jgi:DNA helicase-2/ATP-dependent DNA helicase PcrA
MSTSGIVAKLNAAQQQAVCHKDGPLLVLAGPGSGKTRVITHRISHLLAQDVAPDRILALTFTNKAAEEMLQRVEKLVPQARGLWVSTFHSFCAKMLRREGSVLGYTPGFSIYDVDDQKRALKHVMESLKLDKTVDGDYLRQTISHCKNHCITPAQFFAGAGFSLASNTQKQVVSKIFDLYQQFLKKNNALDFDDLLIQTWELFNHYKDVTDRYQEKFQYILIDEFQDTNLPQYRIAKILAQKHCNICATGDPDQSIYSWRGANIGNILEFEKDFPNAVVVKLEQNYRSTKTILQGASALIANNQLRKQKTLWTENPRGETIRVVEAFDDSQEAEWICQDILRIKHSGRSLQQMVVFYRTNAQSRAMETALRASRIPYIIVGGIEFYKRAEVKDLLAYLRLLLNENDDISLLRIINVPAREIGKTTVSDLVAIARQYNLSLWKALSEDEVISSFAARPKRALRQFAQMMSSLKAKKFPSIEELVVAVLSETGLLQDIKKRDKKENEDREENIKEFLASVREYEKKEKEASLISFLERISLIADVDQWEQQPGQEGPVTLMTLHSAKGLEFPIVYIIGMIEGLLPHARSMESKTALEEERRLMFVGMTRAQDLLTLSHSRLSYRREAYREMCDNTPSRFIEEIPKDICRFIKGSTRFR